MVTFPEFEPKSNSLHDNIMDSLVKPSWLKEGELRDNVWITRLERRNAHRTTHVKFDFNQVVTPFPDVRTLLAPEFELDLITLKLVLFYSMEPRPIGWNRKAASAKITFKAHLALIRWRIDRGIGSNASLTGAWFQEFDDSMKSGVREGLFNLVQRAHLVLSAVETGELSPRQDDRGGIAANDFSRFLGLSTSAEITPFVRQILEQAFYRKGRCFTRSAKNRQNQAGIRTSPTRDNIKSYYKAWWDLWQLRSRLSHDPISYQAFTTRKQMTKRIRNWTATASRTADAPAYQTSYLINSALTLLLDYDVVENVIRLVNEGMDETGQVRNGKLLAQINERLIHLGFPKLAPIYQNNRWRKVEGMTVKTFVFGVLPSAARIITAAFSARRDQEIAGSKINCIEDDSASNSWLN